MPQSVRSRRQGRFKGYVRESQARKGEEQCSEADELGSRKALRHRVRERKMRAMEVDTREVVIDQLAVEGRFQNPTYAGRCSGKASGLIGQIKAAFASSWQQTVKIMGLCFRGFFPCV